MQYAVVIEKAPRNYSAYVPDVPGCAVTGRTVQQTIDRLREALAMHFQDMAERGEQLPDPETIVDHIDVALPETRLAKRTAETLKRSSVT
jgi:predicted RNase H-like HicB family nuclease